VQFDDEWADDAAHQEASARERDLAARRRQWAEEDRRELQGQGEAVRRARRERRRYRWQKSWPWLAFFATAAVLITLSSLLGF
jgi:hypothetical protein